MCTLVLLVCLSTKKMLGYSLETCMQCAYKAHTRQVVWPSLCLSVSVCLLACLFACMLACLSVCLSIRLASVVSLCLSVYNKKLG